MHLKKVQLTTSFPFEPFLGCSFGKKKVLVGLYTIYIQKYIVINVYKIHVYGKGLKRPNIKNPKCLFFA